MQELLSGIDANTQHKDVVLSKCSLLVSGAESDEREQELQLRMDAITEYWKTLEERVQCRVEEMKFELSQTVSVQRCLCVQIMMETNESDSLSLLCSFIWLSKDNHLLSMALPHQCVGRCIVVCLF